MCRKFQKLVGAFYAPSLSKIPAEPFKNLVSAQVTYFKFFKLLLRYFKYNFFGDVIIF